MAQSNYTYVKGPTPRPLHAETRDPRQEREAVTMVKEYAAAIHELREALAEAEESPSRVAPERFQGCATAFEEVEPRSHVERMPGAWYGEAHGTSWPDSRERGALKQALFLEKGFDGVVHSVRRLNYA